jgi:NAD(P)-dependent dehydrogenase (short-subunit alcohol dehydrogenase family)
MRRVTLVTLGSPGCAREVAGLLALARAGPAGAVADKEGRHEDLQQESSDREVEPVRGSRDRAGRRGEGMREADPLLGVPAASTPAPASWQMAW